MIYRIIGFICEVFGFICLPFTTYILLSSLHIVAQILKGNKNKSFGTGEMSGLMFICFGALLIVAFGGQSNPTSDSRFRISEHLDYYYFAWMAVSFGANVAVCRLGCYNDRPLLKSSIPGQLYVFTLALAKLASQCVLLDFSWPVFIATASLSLGSYAVTQSTIASLMTEIDNELLFR